MPTNWKTEFPDYDVPAALIDGLVDTSWRQDMAPTFRRADDPRGDEPLLVLWVDHPDPARREVEGPRFTVSLHPEDETQTKPLLETDDADAARLFFTSYQF